MCQRALRAYVLTYQRAFHAYVFTCQRALRAHVPTCFVCLRTHVPMFLAWLRAHVSMCLTYLRALRAYVLRFQLALRAYVLMCHACLRAHVPCTPKRSRAITSNNKNKVSMTCFTWIFGAFSLSFFWEIKVYMKSINDRQEWKHLLSEFNSTFRHFPNQAEAFNK